MSSIEGVCLQMTRLTIVSLLSLGVTRAPLVAIAVPVNTKKNQTSRFTSLRLTSLGVYIQASEAPLVYHGTRRLSKPSPSSFDVIYPRSAA